MTLRALIFDVDGTLAETEEVHLVAYNTAFAEAGLNWRWTREGFIDLLQHVGAQEQMRAYAAQVGANLSDSEISDLHERKMKAYRSLLEAGDALALRAGVRDLVRDARGCGLSLGIATGSYRKNIESLCHACWGRPADQIFDVIVTGEDVRCKKPSPETYQLALKGLALAPKQTIAIEDSRKGIQAAKAAGLEVLVTPSEFTCKDDLSEGTWIVPSLSRDNLPGKILKHVGMRPNLSFIETPLAGD